MFDWTDLKGSHSLPAFPTFTMNDKTDRFTTATARLGYALFANSLVYIKGGGAWVHNSDVLIGQGPPPFLSESASWTASGWTIGGGFEYRFLPNWSLFIEYNHLDFGTKTITFVAPPGLSSAGEHLGVGQRVDMVAVGLNWRFNFFDGGKTVARY
jgi:outer membrane immunogenic protein